MGHSLFRFSFLLIAVGALFLNSSCESSKGQPVSIPSFLISCDISECNSSVSGQGFVFLMKSNCPDPGELAFEPTASGNTVLSCSSSGCSGTVSSWSDPNGSPISEILSGSYQVCSYVDSNGNLAEESGEPEHESREVITDSTPIQLTTWGVVP